MSNENARLCCSFTSHLVPLPMLHAKQELRMPKMCVTGYMLWSPDPVSHIHAMSQAVATHA